MGSTNLWDVFVIPAQAGIQWRQGQFVAKTVWNGSGFRPAPE